MVRNIYDAVCLFQVSKPRTPFDPGDGGAARDWGRDDPSRGVAGPPRAGHSSRRANDGGWGWAGVKQEQPQPWGSRRDALLAGGALLQGFGGAASNSATEGSGSDAAQGTEGCLIGTARGGAPFPALGNPDPLADQTER